MTNKDDGGNAFPADASTNLFSRGMTLRDWFAGKALQGLLACDSSCGTFQGYAKDAYHYADAMLEARKS